MAHVSLTLDIGGAFTSTLSVDNEGNVSRAKYPTDITDYTNAITRNLERMQLDLKDVDILIHGSVVILNALLRREVAKTGLITTEGFRDTLEIMRTNRPEELIFDIQQTKPKPLVPRHLRFEIPERLNFEGKTLRNLDKGKAEEAIRALKEAKVEAIAVCLLHSYANSAHEEYLREIIEGLLPEIPISLSSKVSSQWREFERTSTTVMNASTLSLMQDYLKRLKTIMTEHGFNKEMLLMQSNGGLTTIENAEELPIITILSSPAAGLMGASLVADTLSLDKVLTYDHGGTGCFLGLLQNGAPIIKKEGNLEQWPVMTPMVDMEGVKTGGNSIVWIDERERLRIGPQDSGSEPGPACFKNGGTEPTVTDAFLLLGQINPEYFNAGEILLDVNSAREAISSRIAEYYGMDVEHATKGIIDLLVSIHAKSAREVATKEGCDLRDCCLMAFGGAGGLSASLLARELGIREVFIPFMSSHMSCIGLLASDLRHDYRQTFVENLEEVRIDKVNALLKDLEGIVANKIKQNGLPVKKTSISRSIEIRYVGQEYALEVPVSKRTLSKRDLIDIGMEFGDLYEKNYGYHRGREAKEIVGLRVTCQECLEKPPIMKRLSNPSEKLKDPIGAFKGERLVLIPGNGQKKPCPTYERVRLQPGNRIQGPAIIEDPYSTIWLLPEDEMSIDEYLNAIILIGR